MDTVRTWRRRFAAATSDRIAALVDRPRTGRPRVHGPAVRAEVVAMACALPAEQDVPLSRWSCPEIARELAIRCQGAVSASSVRRWLAADAIKPWQHRSWISIRDPDFKAKAVRVLDLYAGRWKGRRLGPNDFVICADEKTSIQARCRCHPTLAPGRARAMRVEHEYERRGAVAYLAAWDAHRGQVIGRCEDSTGINPFARLVAQVMTTEPYASADRVFWIVDNGSSHRALIHTPVHASWLNQVEIYFSVVQRKVVSPNDFTDSDQIRDRLAAFETRYNPIAAPFGWKFTRRDLHNLLRRIERHQHDDSNHRQAAGDPRRTYGRDHLVSSSQLDVIKIRQHKISDFCLSYFAVSGQGNGCVPLALEFKREKDLIRNSYPKAQGYPLHSYPRELEVIESDRTNAPQE